MTDELMQKLLHELHLQAEIEGPKNKCIAALFYFQEFKVFLLLDRDNPFTQWLQKNDAVFSKDDMEAAGMLEYYDDGWVCINPMVLGSQRHPYLFFAIPPMAEKFQEILSKQGVDSLVIERTMTNSQYGKLIKWGGPFD